MVLLVWFRLVRVRNRGRDTKDNVFREASLKGVDVEDLKLATSKMKGIQRRTFQAEMVLKYCGGNARQGEAVFGWSRRTISVGLAQNACGSQGKAPKKIPETDAIFANVREKDGKGQAA